MHKSATVFWVALFCLAFAASSAAAPVGKAVSASSTVSASGGNGSRVLGSASPVYFMDRLKTNGSGIGQFEFIDGTKLAMGPSASVVVDKYIVKGRSVQRLGIGATKGAFRFISGHSGSSAYNIVTPYGTIGVRGTAFDFTVRNGKAYLLLLKGQVTFCTGSSCRTIKNTCDYIIAGGGRTTKPEALAGELSDGADLRRIFPLLANPGSLTSSFRRPGGACLSKSARLRVPSKASKANAAMNATEAATPGSPSSPSQPSTPGRPSGGLSVNVSANVGGIGAGVNVNAGSGGLSIGGGVNLGGRR
jgi:hypothetical protein